jgi:hypothetical protein
VGAKAEDFNESVKRTTDDKPSANERFSRPLHGLDYIRVSKPSAEALGYFHSVRFADEGRITFAAKPRRAMTKRALSLR